MNLVAAYILGSLFLIVFFILELDLFHIKKNRAFHRALYPLTKEKYTQLSTEEQKYLIRVLDKKYFLKKKLKWFYRNQECNYFELLGATNEERAQLKEEQLQENLESVNHLLQGIEMWLIGLHFTISVRLILFIFFLCSFSIAIGILL